MHPGRPPQTNPQHTNQSELRFIVSVKRPVVPVPPPPPDQVVLHATVLYGVVLLIASKLGVPNGDLAVAASLWLPACLALRRRRRR